MTPNEYAQIMEANIERQEWQARLDAIRPTFDQRCRIARETGYCADAGYSTSEWAPMIRTSSGRLTTLASCRFDDPERTIARVLRAVS